MTPIERAAEALLAELRRQGEARGVVVEDNGVSAQVDGSFPVEPLVRAVIAAIQEPDAFAIGWGSDPVRELAADNPRAAAQAAWRAMIAALLEEGQ